MKRIMMWVSWVVACAVAVVVGLVFWEAKVAAAELTPDEKQAVVAQIMRATLRAVGHDVRELAGPGEVERVFMREFVSTNIEPVATVVVVRAFTNLVRAEVWRDEAGRWRTNEDVVARGLLNETNWLVPFLKR